MASRAMLQMQPMRNAPKAVLETCFCTILRAQGIGWKVSAKQLIFPQ